MHIFLFGIILMAVLLRKKWVRLVSGVDAPGAEQIRAFWKKKNVIFVIIFSDNIKERQTFLVGYHSYSSATTKIEVAYIFGGQRPQGRKKARVLAKLPHLWYLFFCTT